MNKINICIQTNNNVNKFKKTIESINTNLKFLTTVQKSALHFIVICCDESIEARRIRINTNNFTFIEGESNSDVFSNYKRLFQESRKIGNKAETFTWFLEDDATIINNSLSLLLQTVNLRGRSSSDNYMFNYSHGYGKEFDDDFVKNFHFLKFNNYNTKQLEVDKFASNYDTQNYQLSMLVFRNNCLLLKDFPIGDIFENDVIILESLKGTIKISAEHIYQQGKCTQDKKVKFKTLNDYASGDF